MRFINETPKVNCLNELEHYKRFLHHGQYEFCDFLQKFLNLEQVRIQSCELDVLKNWLKVENIDIVMDVPENDKEICVVSQIQVNGQLIAYFPYVLKGRNVKKYLEVKSLLTKLSEAISDQITLCYIQEFKGGDWIFGENLAKMIVSNCISTRQYDGIKFVHLIEKLEQLATSTFEGAFFPTGVIVCADSSKYKENYFEFVTAKHIDDIDKREWFLVDGQESFFLLDSGTNCRGIFRKSMSSSDDFVGRYFEKYYLSNDLVAPDFVVRTTGVNEISIIDSDGKEFVKVENVWKYRHCKNITQFLVEQLGIEYKLSYAILYYTLRCSQNHVSSIIWIPNNCDEESISNLTTANKVRMWKKQLSILDESHQILIEKILASDGAIVLGKDGKIIYESVFADMSKASVSKVGLVGSGETASQFLAENGVAIKISQDGTIKIFAGNEKIYY